MPGHAAHLRNAPSPPGPGAPRLCAQVMGVGAACMPACCGEGAETLPSGSSPRPASRLPFRPGGQGQPQNSPGARSRCAGGAVSLCPLNSPAATSSPFLSKYGCSPYKWPHPSAPQRRREALADPAPSSGALLEPPDSPHLECP